MALSSEVIVTLSFGIVMAVLATMALWQVAHYAAGRSRRMLIPMIRRCLG